MFFKNIAGSCKVKFNIEVINIDGRDMNFLSSFNIEIKKRTKKYPSSLYGIPFTRINSVLAELEDAKRLKKSEISITKTGYDGVFITIPRWAYDSLIKELEDFEINDSYYKNYIGLDVIKDIFYNLVSLSDFNFFGRVFNKEAYLPEIQTLQGFATWLSSEVHHTHKELCDAKSKRAYEVQSCRLCPHLAKSDLGYCELSKRNLDVSDISEIVDGKVVQKNFPNFCKLKFV